MNKKLERYNLNVFLKGNELLYGIQALELERKRIARELHDDISSKLNVVALNCHLLKIPNISQMDVEDIKNTIFEYTTKAIESSKKMTSSLLPPVLDKFGLHAGLEELCSDLIQEKKVDIQYQNNLSFDYKEDQKAIHVYRIIEELLYNSIIHGKASLISIEIGEWNEKVKCDYTDNGIGFEVKSIENHSGNGFKNIASRMAVLNGNFSIQSDLNEGVSIVFDF